MCWNEPVSWIVFFVGTLFNIYLIWKIKTPVSIVIAISWQWVLLMQLFDALLWRDQNCGSLNKFATKSAYIANITQPIVVFLTLIVISKAAIKFKIMSCVVVLIYIIYMIQARPGIGKLDCVKEKGGHLNYFWWDKMKFGGILYTVALVLIMLLLLRPTNLSIFEVSYVLITLVISITFFKYNTPSIWCWFAAFAPIANVIFFSFNKN
jgi:hypothetical protein